jgi:FAD/FMN-containing dehydrogenase
MQGEVFFDPAAKYAYTKDSAGHQGMPVAVAVPRSLLDQQIALEIARDLNVPVISRGAGTSLRGQSVGEGLVIDTRRYLHRILNFDRSAMTVRVEPGISLAALNANLATHDLWFAADMPLAEEITVGGMVGNNAVGYSALRYGDTAKAVKAMDLILADGTQALFGSFGDGGEMVLSNARLNRLIPELFQIADTSAVKNQALGVSSRFSNTAGLVNFAQWLAGAEGTLATMQSVTLKLARRPRYRLSAVVVFSDLAQMASQISAISSLGPAAVVLTQATTKGRASVSIAFDGDDERELRQRLRDLETIVVDLGLVPPVVSVDWAFGEPVSRQDLCLQDCLIPLPLLMDVVWQMDQIFARFGIPGVWRGHVTQGAFYLRPTLARTEITPSRLEDIQAAVDEFVMRFRQQSDPPKVAAQIKAAFDPQNLLNPGRTAVLTR